MAGRGHRFPTAASAQHGGFAGGGLCHSTEGGRRRAHRRACPACPGCSWPFFSILPRWAPPEQSIPHPSWLLEIVKTPAKELGWCGTNKPSASCERIVLVRWPEGPDLSAESFSSEGDPMRSFRLPPAFRRCPTSLLRCLPILAALLAMGSRGESHAAWPLTPQTPPPARSRQQASAAKPPAVREGGRAIGGSSPTPQVVRAVGVQPAAKPVQGARRGPPGPAVGGTESGVVQAGALIQADDCGACGKKGCKVCGIGKKIACNGQCGTGGCPAHCPVRPDQFGYYPTRWRNWPGQGVKQVSHFDPATTPVVPPKSEIPGIDEESPPRQADEEEEAELEAPAEAEPMEADDVATDDVPTDDVPTDDMPTDDMPTDDMPTDDVPTDDVPTDDMPTDDVPTDDGDTEELPAAELDGNASPDASSSGSQVWIESLTVEPVASNPGPSDLADPRSNQRPAPQSSRRIRAEGTWGRKPQAPQRGRGDSGPTRDAASAAEPAVGSWDRVVQTSAPAAALPAGDVAPLAGDQVVESRAVPQWRPANRRSAAAHNPLRGVTAEPVNPLR